MNKVDSEQLEAFAAPILSGLGYELVDIEWQHEAGNWILRLYIDFPASAVKGSQVSHEDCARASHAVSAELDVADIIQVPFHLEMSSPGLNRVLRRECDFQRFAGRKVKLRTKHPVSAASESAAAAAEQQSSQGAEAAATSAAVRRNFSGLIVGVASGLVRIDVDGRIYEIPVADVEKANLQFEL